MIEFKNLSKVFNIGKKQTSIALDTINLRINQGEIFGIVGYSGAGKSTLLRMINLLEVPTEGEIWINQQKINTQDYNSIKNIRSDIGMIFQQFNLLRSKTVRENIAFPLRLEKKYQAQDIMQRVDELLHHVGLFAHQHKYPSQLSGGQKQRVGIARALANHPKILLCDEATSALDPSTTHEILNLLLEINQKLGITIVLITHEMGVIKRICDRVAILSQGQIVEYGTVQTVFLNPQHAVTKQLIAHHFHDHLDWEYIKNINQASQFVQLTLVGDQVYQPILSQLSKNHQIDYQILYGQVEYMKNIPYSQLSLALSGDHVSDAIQDLQQQHIDIRQIIVQEKQ